MKFGLIVVAVAILSAIAAQALLADPGYVSISVRGYLFEMSVPVLVGAIVVLIVGLWLLRQLWLTPRRLGQAYGRGRADRAGKKLTWDAEKMNFGADSQANALLTKEYRDGWGV